MDLSGNQGELPIPMQAPASPNASGLVLLPSPPAAATEELGNNNNGTEALVLLPSPPAAAMEEEYGNNKNGNEAAPVLLPSPPAAATEEEQGNNNNGNEAPVLLPSPPAAAATEEEESSGLKKPAAVSVTGAIGTGAGPVVKYRECLKNHAAAMGGNATDGCGEFMPSGEEGSLEALKCAACGCHRNFHRKEVDDDAGHGNGCSYGHRFTDPYAAMHAPPPLHHHQLVNAVPLSAVHTAEPGARGSASSMKRFRTKFSAEQKARMLAFAERAGWRLTNVDEGAVQAFCQEIGVRRPVLKVWMHNNKYTLRSKRLQAPPVAAAAASPPSPPPPQILMPMVPPPPPPSSPQHEGLAFVHLGGPSSPPPPQQMMMPMAPPFRRSPGSPPLKLN